MTALPLGPADDLSPRRTPCGGCDVRVAGTRLRLRTSGAAYLPDSRTLIVSDLHLEKGSAYARRGQPLPPYDSRDTLSRLEAEVAALAPARLVLLGDTFHDADAEDRLAPTEVARLCRLAQATDLVFIVGNHDADGPRGLPGRVMALLAAEGLTLIHEPQAGAAFAEVAGHLHPVVRVHGRARSVRRRAFLTDGRRLILPAFGAYAGGLNVKDAAFAGLFGRPPMAFALGRDQVHGLSWSALADGV